MDVARIGLPALLVSECRETLCHVCELPVSGAWEPYLQVLDDGDYEHVAVHDACITQCEREWVDATLDYLDEPFEHATPGIAEGERGEREPEATDTRFDDDATLESEDELD